MPFHIKNVKVSEADTVLRSELQVMLLKFNLENRIREFHKLVYVGTGLWVVQY